MSNDVVVTSLAELISNFLTLSTEALSTLRSLTITQVNLHEEIAEIEYNATEQKQTYALADGTTFSVPETNQEIFSTNLFYVFSRTVCRCPQLQTLIMDDCNMGYLLDMLMTDLNYHCLKLETLKLTNDDFSSEQLSFTSVQEPLSGMHSLRFLDLSDSYLFEVPEEKSDVALMTFLDHCRAVILTVRELSTLSLTLNKKDIEHLIHSLANAVKMPQDQLITRLEQRLSDEEDAWLAMIIDDQMIWLIQNLQDLLTQVSSKRKRDDEASDDEQFSIARVDDSYFSTPSEVILKGRNLLGIEQIFELQEIPGDGDCGFNALAVTRHEMADFLLQYVNDPTVIIRFKKVLLEILTMQGHPLHIDIQLQEQALRDSLQELLPDDIFDKIKDLEKRIEWLNDHEQYEGACIVRDIYDAKLAADHCLDAFLQDPHVFKVYTELLRQQLWLDTESIKFYAQQHNFNVCVWQQQAGAKGEISITLEHSFYRSSFSDTRHLLYDGQHFNLLKVQPALSLQVSDIAQLGCVPPLSAGLTQAQKTHSPRDKFIGFGDLSGINAFHSSSPSSSSK